MFAKLSVLMAAFAAASLAYTVQSIEAPYPTLTYRVYLMDFAEKATPVREETYVFQKRDLSSARYFLKTTVDVATKRTIEKDVLVVVSASGNIVREGNTRWHPYRPLIIGSKQDTRVDYTVFPIGSPKREGRSYLLSFGYRDVSYAGNVWRVLEVRTDLTEAGVMRRHKCKFIVLLGMIGSCRSETKDGDELIRLEKIKY